MMVKSWVNDGYPAWSTGLQFANWKDPPFYSWVNQLFRLGHGFNSYVTVITRGFLGDDELM